MKTLMLAVLTAASTLAWADYTPSEIPSADAKGTSPAVMPGMVNFQGLLRNPSDGSLYVDGAYDLECRLYDSVSGGSVIWGGTYSAYVKDGYFNIMLGQQSRSELTKNKPKYKSNELWKALWYRTGNKTLYLGITPWHDAAHNPISEDDRKEIAPRQQLLAAPFALRAHKAQYADAAPGNFTVNGDITINGELKLPNSQGIKIPQISATASSVTVGDAGNSTSTLVGGEVNVESDDDLNINPGANANITLQRYKKLNITGGTVSLENSEANIKNTSKVVMDTPLVDINSSSFWVSGSTYGVSSLIQMEGNGTLIKNDHVELSGKNDRTRFTVDGGHNQQAIIGKGDLKWVENSKGVEAGSSPIVIRTVDFTLPSGQQICEKSLSSLMYDNTINVADYSWVIVGFTYDKRNMNQIRWGYNFRWMHIYGTTLQVGMEYVTEADRYFQFQLMGINKKWCSDNRSSDDGGKSGFIPN